MITPMSYRPIVRYQLLAPAHVLLSEPPEVLDVLGALIGEIA
jgi:hypothetical protein